MIEKNEMLDVFMNEFQEMVKMKDIDERNQKLKNIMNLIRRSQNNEDDWMVFEENFNKVHVNFFEKLLERNNTLSPADLRLCAYILMNKTTKEIATLLGITVRGVETGRFRLRKKLGLSRTDNLIDILLSL